MKLVGAWILLSAVLAEGRLRKLGGVSQALSAAEGEVAAHMDAVIEHAYNTDGWDVEDVLSNIDVRVGKILDAHGVGGAEKEMAMDHLDNRLSTMLEEISFNKELEQQEMRSEGMTAAESEVAAHMERIIERAKNTDGWDVEDVVSSVNEHVSQVLDTHGVDGIEKEMAIEHLDHTLSTMLEEISVAKEFEPADDAEAMKAAENEVAAHMEGVIERAKNTDGWDIAHVVSSVNGHVSKVLDTHGIEGAAKEKSMEHLDNKLHTMLKKISEAKEFELSEDAEAMEEEDDLADHMDQMLERENSELDKMLDQIKENEPAEETDTVEEMKAAENFEAMQAAETEVAAHMDAVIKRAKAVDGWELDDVLRKVDVGVSKILDDHAIGDAAKEKAMDHLNNKLSTMLEDISAEKESKQDMESEAMMAAEAEVAAFVDPIIKAAKAEDGWNTKDAVSSVGLGVNQILDTYGIVGAKREQAMDHFNNKLSKVLDEISAEQDWSLNF